MGYGVETALGDGGTTEPLWEIGVGAVEVYSPDYPASDDNHFNGLVLPFGIYRGDIFRVGDDGVARAIAVETPRVELDLSLGASFDAESSDNEARRDMPDLDFLVEVGPELKIHLAPALEDLGITLDLVLPIRGVFSTDFRGMDQRGMVFAPELEYEHERIWGTRLEVSVSWEAVWASERLMDYFYEVDPEFATAGRPAFQASGGYLGNEFSASGVYDVTSSFRVFLGARLGWYANSRNDESPLFRDRTTVGVAGGLLWIPLQSKGRVRRR